MYNNNNNNNNSNRKTCDLERVEIILILFIRTRQNNIQQLSSTREKLFTATKSKYIFYPYVPIAITIQFVQVERCSANAFILLFCQ